MILAGLVLGTLFSLAGASILRPSLLLALVTALLSATWLSVNNPVLEGATLLVVGEGRGVTVADLVALTGAGLAVLSVARWKRQRPVGSGRAAMDATVSAHRRDRYALVCIIAVVTIMIIGASIDVIHQPG